MSNNSLSTHFQWEQSFSHIGYQIVPKGHHWRIFNPAGDLFNKKARTPEQAKELVNRDAVCDRLFKLFEVAREQGIVSNDQMEKLTDLVWFDPYDDDDQGQDQGEEEPLWVTAREIADELNISPQFIGTLRRDGKMTEKVHFRAVTFEGRVLKYQYNFDACKALLGVNTEAV